MRVSIRSDRRWRASDARVASWTPAAGAAIPITKRGSHVRTCRRQWLGRTGRSFLRSAYARHAGIEVVAVNDLADAATLAYLLKYDSVGGRFPGDCAPATRSSSTAGRSPRSPTPTPASFPGTSWRRRGHRVHRALPRTRRRRRHLHAGARKVIISAPAKGDEPPDATVVLGVNFDEVYDPERHHIISNASCTTNCLAPVAEILHQSVGIRHGPMTTVHAYTGDQMLLDGPHKDLRRARSAAINIVPTSTGAAKALGLVIPNSPAACTATPSASPPDRVADRPDRRDRAAHDHQRDQRRLRPTGRPRTAARHPGLRPGPDRLHRHHRLQLLVHLRRRPDLRHRRHPSQGRGLVRQRIRLLQPTGRPRRAHPRPRRRRGRRLNRRPVPAVRVTSDGTLSGPSVRSDRRCHRRVAAGACVVNRANPVARSVAQRDSV